MASYAKLWLGPDAWPTGEGLKGPEILFFMTAAAAVEVYLKLGDKRSGSRIQTVDGFFSERDILSAASCRQVSQVSP